MEARDLKFVGGASTDGAFEETTKFRGMDAVLRNLARTEEDDGHVVGVALAQQRISINIHLVQRGGEFAQERSHRRLGFIAQMTVRARVDRDVARPRNGQAAGFRAGIKVAAFAGLKQALADQPGNGIKHGFALGRRIAANEFEQGVQVESSAVELIEERQDAISSWDHIVCSAQNDHARTRTAFH
jgi:hypothetical protein